MKNQEIKNICPTTTAKKEKEGALVVDVREENEVKELSYDVQNLLHIPLSEFEDRYSEVPKDKSVIMACKGGGRSLKAAYFLQNKGYNDVMNLDGGILKWAEKKFPVKGDTAKPNESTDDCCSSSNCC